ncbi:MAG: magnesium transporter CorA family protein [Candidatus Nealsonbacteria bacterium]|nr:magnesium transporter CorA family protein [Candidatus Nealsonbacteria bacterium]
MRNIIKGPRVSWIDIQNPTEEDVQFLKEKFGFHPLVLSEIIPPGNRGKAERYDDYIFMILYYPLYNKEKRETRPQELDVIVTKDTVITSHYHSILPLKALFDKCNLYKEQRKTCMSENSGELLYYILSNFWKTCLTKLIRIDKRIDEIEKEMFRGKEKEMVLEISFVKTDIINFWRIIEHQEEILQSLSKEGVDFFGPQLTPYFSDILGTYSKSLNALKTYKEAVLALENTNQSLLSTKINDIIRILTVFSVIVFPLTLLASIWGMNVPMPLTDSLFGFPLIISMMFIATVFMIIYFKKKRWI